MSFSAIKGISVECDYKMDEVQLDSYTYTPSPDSSSTSPFVRFPEINKELPNQVFNLNDETFRKNCALINRSLATFFSKVPYRPSSNQNIVSYLFHCIAQIGATEDEVEGLIKVYKKDPGEFSRQFKTSRFYELLNRPEFIVYGKYLQSPYETIVICAAAFQKKEKFASLTQQLTKANFLSRAKSSQSVLQVLQFNFFEAFLHLRTPSNKGQIDQLFEILGKANSQAELQEDLKEILPKLDPLIKQECEVFLSLLGLLEDLNLGGCSWSTLLPFLPTPTASAKAPIPKSDLLVRQGGFEVWKENLNALSKELEHLRIETAIFPQEKHVNKKKIAQQSDILTIRTQVVAKIDHFSRIKDRLIGKLQDSFKEAKEDPQKATTFQFQFEESAFLLDFLLELHLVIAELHLENLTLQDTFPKDTNLQVEGRVLKRRIVFLQGFTSFTEFFFAAETRLSIQERAKLRQQKGLEVAEYEEMVSAKPKKAKPLPPPISLDHAKEVAALSPTNFLQGAVTAAAQKVVKFDFIGAFTPFILLKRETLDTGSVRSKEMHDHFAVAAQNFEMWAATLKLQRFDLAKVSLHQCLSHLSIALEQYIKREDDPSVATEHHSLVRLVQESRQKDHPLYHLFDQTSKELRYPFEDRLPKLSTTYKWLDQFERLAGKPTHLKALQKAEIPAICKCFQEACALLGYSDSNFEKLQDEVQRYLTTMKWTGEVVVSKKSDTYQKLETTLKAHEKSLKQSADPYDPVPVLKDALYFVDFTQKAKELETLFPDASLKFCHLSNHFEAEKALRALLKASALCHGSDVIVGHHYSHFTNYLHSQGIVLFDRDDWVKLNGSYLGLKHHYWHILEEGHDRVSYHTTLDRSLETAKGFKEVAAKKKETDAELQKDPRPVAALLEKLIAEKLDLLLNIKRTKTIPQKV